MFSHNICSSREVSVHGARKPDDVETRMLMAAWPAKDIESCATSSVTARMSTRVVVLLSDCFFIALFSALEQTHCAHVACDYECVTVSFYSGFLNSH